MVLVRGILLLSVAVLAVATAETTAAGQDGKIAKDANTGCVAVTGASESGPSVPLFTLVHRQYYRVLQGLVRRRNISQICRHHANPPKTQI